MVLIRKEAYIEKNTKIEKLKTTRKEKTAITINNNITNNITNNIINHIQTKYPNNYDITAYKEMLSDTYNAMVEPFKEEPYEMMLKFFDSFKNFNDLFKLVMDYRFSEPDAKCLFFFEETKKFYAIYASKTETNQIKETDFDKECKQICEEVMVKIMKFMLDNVPNYRKIDKYNTIDNEGFDKHTMLMVDISAISSNMSGIKELSEKYFKEDYDPKEQKIQDNLSI
ncbi:MAG: hypothetical protein ACRCZI_02820 [Cetobacterium sp.]